MLKVVAVVIKSQEDCLHCKGNGKIVLQVIDPILVTKNKIKRCEACKGSGKRHANTY